MVDANALLENQRIYLRSVQTAWDNAYGQAQLLSDLSRRHGEAIGRSETKAARDAWARLQELSPKLASREAGDAFTEYLKDFGQRWTLFLDTLCRRGDACIVREKEGFKPVLAFDYDVIIDGRKLERPVNYTLVRIKPPNDTMPPREDGRPWSLSIRVPAMAAGSADLRANPRSASR